MKKIFIASDHAGFPLKKHLLEAMPQLKLIDLGPENEDRVDYPDFATKLCGELKNNEEDFGILVCGSGQGMAMRANRYEHIRAALCWNNEMSQLSREHNNANVLCLGSRMMDWPECEKMILTFIETKFAGGRHEDRVKKIHSPT